MLEEGEAEMKKKVNGKKKKKKRKNPESFETYHLHPDMFATPSILNMAHAKSPPKAPDSADATVKPLDAA